MQRPSLGTAVRPARGGQGPSRLFFDGLEIISFEFIKLPRFGSRLTDRLDRRLRAFRRQQSSRPRASALPSDQFAQLPITPPANFDRPREIGIISQPPPQPHITGIAIALS